MARKPRTGEFQFELTGDRQLIKALNALPTAAINRIVRPSMQKSTRTLRADLKNTAPKDRGALRAAIRIQTESIKQAHTAEEYAAMRGVRRAKAIGIRGRVGPVSKLSMRKKKIRGKRRKLSKNKYRYNPKGYAHLLEYGTKHMQAQPFLRPALARHRNEIIRIFSAEVRRRVPQEIVKYTRKRDTRK